MPDPRQGAAMVQAFQQLMQNPASQQAMLQGAQQMGIPPQMIQQLMSAGGGGGGGAPPMPAGGGGGGPPMMPQGGDMPPEAGGGPPMDPEAMAQGQIDGAGNTWDGVDAPTQNDIQRLTEDPSPEAIESFNAQFGEGAAEKYLGGGSEDAEQGTEPPAGNESEADEY